MKIFEKLIEKYFEGSLTEEDGDLLIEIVDSSPVMKERFILTVQLNNLLYAAYAPEHADEAMVKRIQTSLAGDMSRKFAGRKVLERIEQVKMQKKRKRIIRKLAWFAVAACIAVAAGFYYMHITKTADPVETADPVKKIDNVKTADIPVPKDTKLTSIAKLTDADTGVTVKRGDALVAAEPGMDIYKDDTIQTGLTHTACLKIKDSEIILGRSTELIVLKQDITLTRGRIECTAAHQASESQVRFLASHIETKITGTKFKLNTDGQTSFIRVGEGEVQVSNLHNAQETLRVPQGFYVNAVPGKPLKIQKANAVGLYNLARVFRNKGDFEESAALLKEAGDIAKPGSRIEKSVYYTLSEILYVLEDFKGAEGSALKQVGLNYQVPYGEIEIFIARTRLGKKTSRLAEFRKQWQNKEWPGPVIDMFLNKITLDEAVKIAEATNDPGKLSSVYYYIGEYWFFKNDINKAKEYFRKASEIKNTNWSDPVIGRKRLAILESRTSKNH
jgi:tetratricopeptide (TPR) repeat protein